MNECINDYQPVALVIDGRIHWALVCCKKYQKMRKKIDVIRKKKCEMWTR